jgi:hypothetical protein
MIIIDKSNELTLLKVKNKDSMNLIYQFFIHTDYNRNIELKRCLSINVANKYIDNIYLLNEKIYSDKELGIKSNKIKQINIDKRIEYKDIFEYILDNKISGYNIFINADIFLDKSIEIIRYSDIHLKKKIIALLRYDYLLSKKPKLFGPRYDSQDTWIIHSNFNITKKQKNIFDFQFGKPGCDNKLLYLMKILDYEIINDPLLIKTYHYHETEIRNYNNKDLIKNPYYLSIPHNININNIQNQFNIKLSTINIFTDNFSKFNMGDNILLYNYIQRKILLGENFIIPRIAGIENNYAYYGNVIQFNYDENINNYFKNTMHVMKNNAGIQLNDINSIILYSNMYLKAFENCEIYSAWEIWGNVYLESQKLIDNNYNKINFWAFTFDIFHYIYSNPWTLSLKNKRILIISSFIESIKEKIPIRKHLYGIDLFPNCEFIFSKPPQTQGNQESQDFIIELNNYTKELDNIMNDFDIALVSCGGYGNLVCNYIYENGKSAIYVGGVLQMYFGIIGERWIRERPDIIKLFKNKYWSRPKIAEKPKNYKNIEDSCYW